MTTVLLAALVNSVVLGSLVAGAVTLVLRLLPRRTLNAATRYAIWWITLVVAVALPAMRFPVPAISFARRGAGPVATPYVPPVGDIITADLASEEGSLVVRAAPQPKGRSTRPAPIFAVQTTENWWPRGILGICGLLGAVMLLRLAVSCWMLGRTKSRAVAVPQSQSLLVEGWMARCGSRRKNIRLKISNEISCPVAAGPMSAAILVPAGFFEELTDAEIDQAGLHETAHFARHDDYSLLVQRTLEALLCWHPAVRWITRQIDLEREIACDDFVVEALGEPRSYASCLTRLAELATGRRASILAAGAIEKGSQLTRRVELLLDCSRHTGTRLLRFRLAGVALIPLVLALWAARIPEVIAFAKPSPAQPQSTAAARPQATPAPVPAPAQALSKPADPGVDEWIKTNAIPLSTVEAGHGFADMQPLKKVIGNARIVALGDATLGTREIFQMKHRMLEFLVTQMGFNMFSIAGNMPEAYRLNDYVLNGNGDPVELIKGMYFWVWDTQEVLDMVQWMREYNKSGRGRVEFTGFDMQTPTVAGKIVREFAGKYEPDYLPVIVKAPYVTAAVSRSFGGYPGTFPVGDAAGKTVRFSANIKTQDVTEYAGLWWRADGAKDGGNFSSIAFENLRNAAPKGTTDWKRYELEIAIPAETKNINFGVLLAGGGTAWFDGLEVAIDGRPYTKAQGFDLMSTKRRPGTFPLALGYTGTFENQESSGAPGPALELKRTTPLDDPASKNQPKQAAAMWREILDHMEASRSLYAMHGASPKDTDWAIQNARVVLQSIQLNTHEITRDRAMADNVKWILDHSPSDTKVVLWTHNQHVETRFDGMMGTVLRQMYGNQMVTFGFAFNQGAFRAIETNNGTYKGLRTFTVPPAPSGSFEATLAASGIPIFALDLRQATGTAAAWLNEPHKARSLGVGYSEEQPENYFQELAPRPAFDAVLFMDSTTATVPNVSSPSAGIATCTNANPSQVCRDKEYAVSFTLPAGWSVNRSWRWGDNQNTVAFTDPQAIPGQMHPSLWYTVRLTPLQQTPAQTLAAFQEIAQVKVRQRQDAGLADYHVRPNSCHARNVGSLPGWSCIAEFTDQSGKAMAEYLTWADSGNTRAEFFGSIPASGLDSYMTRFEAIIQTLQIP